MPAQTLALTTETPRTTDSDANLFHLIEKGVSKADAMHSLGMDAETLDQLLKCYGIIWPTDETQSRKGRCRNVYWVRMRGHWVTLADAARLRNRPYNALLERYKRGERGAALFRQVRTYRRREQVGEPEVYSTGFSEHKWREVIGHAKAQGTDAAAVRYNIPTGAVKAALCGQFERLD